ncbi:hypothetical protein J7L01_07025, partial [bacterium]|nr:hypothetical protein [bacterium]
MKKRNVLITVVLLAAICGGAFAQFAGPTPFSGAAARNMPMQIPSDIDAASAISFDEALSGDGDIYVLYALWSPDRGKLLDSKIIPIVRDGKGLALLGDVRVTYPSNAQTERWSGFPEYGFQSKTETAKSDRAEIFSTANAAPNLNFTLEDGDIVSLNLVYIEGTQANLVSHSSIVMKRVFDAKTFSLEEGKMLDNFYRPDKSALVLRSHFGILGDGELVLSKEAGIWGRSIDGLYAMPLDARRSGRRYVGYNRAEGFAMACDEMALEGDSWDAV